MVDGKILTSGQLYLVLFEEFASEMKILRFDCYNTARDVRS